MSAPFTPAQLAELGIDLDAARAIDEVAIDRPRAWHRTITDARLSLLSDGYRLLILWHLDGPHQGTRYVLPPVACSCCGGGPLMASGCRECGVGMRPGGRR